MKFLIRPSSSASVKSSGAVSSTSRTGPRRPFQRPRSRPHSSARALTHLRPNKPSEKVAGSTAVHVQYPESNRFTPNVKKAQQFTREEAHVLYPGASDPDPIFLTETSATRSPSSTSLKQTQPNLYQAKVLRQQTQQRVEALTNRLAHLADTAAKTHEETTQILHTGQEHVRRRNQRKKLPVEVFGIEARHQCGPAQIVQCSRRRQQRQQALEFTKARIHQMKVSAAAKQKHLEKQHELQIQTERQKQIQQRQRQRQAQVEMRKAALERQSHIASARQRQIQERHNRNIELELEEYRALQSSLRDLEQQEHAFLERLRRLEQTKQQTFEHLEQQLVHMEQLRDYGYYV